MYCEEDYKHLFHRDLKIIRVTSVGDFQNFPDNPSRLQVFQAFWTSDICKAMVEETKAKMQHADGAVFHIPPPYDRTMMTYIGML